MGGTLQKQVILGRITGLLGVRGWIKVHSYTHPRDNIIDFDRWILRQGDVDRAVELETGRPQGRTVVAKLKGIDDREQARILIGADIAVERAALPPCDPGEFYWMDLEGLAVRTLQGDPLGQVDYLFGTGDHDVMVVAGDRERLIPFVRERVVREVDLQSGIIVVDWDPNF